MQTVIFSDLDGCLLDKQTYSFQPAVPILQEAKHLGIPVILASSKTEPEMLRIARELDLAPAPIICENGGAILWRTHASSSGSTAKSLRGETVKSLRGETENSLRSETVEQSDKTILGTPRERLLDVLSSLKERYRFRSFRDLGVEGIAEATGLDRERAQQAAERNATEPLLWDDAADTLDAFREAIQAHGLTLTRGGRFWHLAGKTTKGAAMQEVVLRLFPECLSIAVGDSPIDQSMLDVANVPIGIPQPNGELLVTIPAQGLVATEAGPSGWAVCVRQAITANA